MERRGRKGLGIRRGEGEGREGREGVGRNGKGKGGLDLDICPGASSS